MLSRQATQIIAEELERASTRAGRRLLSLYLQDLTQAQVLEVLRSPQKSQAAIDSAIANSGNLTLGMTSPQTAEKLRALEFAVRASSDFSISLFDAAVLLKKELDVSITAPSIRAMIVRSHGAHKLEVRNSRVRLRADALTEAIAVRHRERKQQIQQPTPLPAKKRKK